MKSKHFHSPYAKTLVLVVGTLILLLITSYLVRVIDETYISDNDGWIYKKVATTKEQVRFAALKSAQSGVVLGDAHISSNGDKVSIDVAFSGVAVAGAGKTYNLYFGNSSDDSKVFIARFGEPQVTNGKPTYRLTGWGPDLWLNFDSLYIIEESAKAKSDQKVLLEGLFAEQ